MEVSAARTLIAPETLSTHALFLYSDVKESNARNTVQKFHPLSMKAQ